MNACIKKGDKTRNRCLNECDKMRGMCKAMKIKGCMQQCNEKHTKGTAQNEACKTRCQR